MVVIVFIITVAAAAVPSCRGECVFTPTDPVMKYAAKTVGNSAVQSGVNSPVVVVYKTVSLGTQCSGGSRLCIANCAAIIHKRHLSPVHKTLSTTTTHVSSTPMPTPTILSTTTTPVAIINAQNTVSSTADYFLPPLMWP